MPRLSAEQIEVIVQVVSEHGIPRWPSLSLPGPAVDLLGWFVHVHSGH